MGIPKSIWKKIALLAMGLAVGLVLCELMLRAAGISYPLPYAPDPYCGTRLMAGFRGWWQKEGRGYIRVNPYGFRHGQRGPEKPPDTLRVAVLGDSFIEAFQVHEDQTLCAVVEEELGKCSAAKGRAVQVLNFGVSGYGTAQELQMLRHYVWPYKPDVVVLAFFPGNDVRNNSADLEPYKVRPFYRLEDGRVELDDSFHQHSDYLKAHSTSVRWKVWLINHSRLLQLVNELRNRRGQADGGRAATLGAGIDVAPWIEPPDSKWQQAWELTDRLILETAQEVRRHGSDFLLLVIGSDVDVHPDSQERERVLNELGVSDLRYAEQRLEQLGRQHDFAVLSLASPMGRHAREHHEYLHGFQNSALGTGHWNAAGNRVAGRLTARAICDLWTSVGESPRED